jgi:N-acetylneuraminic acid mutarotase
VALNGQLYVLGGNNGADVTTVQVYDPHKNKWKTLPALPSGVQVSGAVAVYGMIFMEGGDAGSGTMNQYAPFAPAIP